MEVLQSAAKTFQRSCFLWRLSSTFLLSDWSVVLDLAGDHVELSDVPAAQRSPAASIQPWRPGLQIWPPPAGGDLLLEVPDADAAVAGGVLPGERRRGEGGGAGTGVKSCPFFSCSRWTKDIFATSPRASTPGPSTACGKSHDPLLSRPSRPTVSCFRSRPLQGWRCCDCWPMFPSDIQVRHRWRHVTPAAS